MPEFDLFGEVEPATGPKNREGYLTHLASLTFPAGHLFWCLSADKPPRGFDTATTDMVCFRTETNWVHALVDIRTGRVLTQVRTEPLAKPQKRPTKHGRKKATPAG